MSQSEPNTQPNGYTVEDEIDLADLVAVLHRRRWLIAMVTALVALLGLGYSLLVLQKYEYRSLLEIGQFQTSEGDYQHVEPPKAAAERLKAAAQTVFHKRDREAGEKELGYGLESFQVSAAENGGVVEMKLQAPWEAEVQSFMEAVSRQLVQDHDRIFAVEEQTFRQEIKTLEAKLKELNQKAASFKRRLKQLGEEKAFLRKQIQESTARIDDLLETKAQANISTPQEPVGLLLFSSEIQRVRSYIDELRTRLLAEIPEKREQLQVNLESTQSRITSTRAKLESQRIALKNINRTQVLLAPTVSDNPVAPNLKLNTALALVLGLFLAIFLAFALDFWRANRDRIVNESNQG